MFASRLTGSGALPEESLLFFFCFLEDPFLQSQPRGGEENVIMGTGSIRGSARPRFPVQSACEITTMALNIEREAKQGVWVRCSWICLLN